MDILRDVSRADWLVARAHGWGTVASVVGGGFESYARILHPVTATREDLTTTNDWGCHPWESRTVRWADVAEHVGRTMHPLVQWTRLSRTQYPQSVELEDRWTVGQPDEGQLDRAVLAALSEHLGRATSTPDDLVAGVWEGHGSINGSSTVGIAWTGDADEAEMAAEQARLRRANDERNAAILAAIAGPRFAWPLQRDLVPFTTTIDELADGTWFADFRVGGTPDAPGQSPQLLFPADRAWALGTEIDFDSTIVGGPAGLVDAILGDDRLETFPVGEDDDLSWNGDTINVT